MRAVVRIATAMATAVAALLVFGVAAAIPALAQTGGYNPPVEVSPEIITGGGAGAGAAPAGGALAFTGAELTLLFLALAALVTIGALALIAARRRAA